MTEPTYIFRDGRVYTFLNGKVVAAVKESEFAPEDGQMNGQVDSQGQGPVEMPDVPYELRDDLQDSADCPSCGTPSSPEDQFCSQCGEPLAQGGGEEGGVPGGVPGADLYGQAPPEQAQMVAHVTTPNGLKGRVLGRVQGTWGEEVTVRFENGVIKRLPVSQDLSFETEKTAAQDDPIAGLTSSLEETYQGDKDSLIKRLTTLDEIKTIASRMVQGAPDDMASTLDSIVAKASYEHSEVEAALSHIGAEETEAFEPFAPIENLPAVEQASFGKGGTWLDKTLGEMQAEAAATDYKKLMDEGPEAFVAGLEDAALADSGTVRHIALRWIRSHTAGADEKIRDKYDRVWLARVEEQRRQRLSARKEEIRKEAAAQESFDGPDDALFL